MLPTVVTLYVTFQVLTDVLCWGLVPAAAMTRSCARGPAGVTYVLQVLLVSICDCCSRSAAC